MKKRKRRLLVMPIRYIYWLKCTLWVHTFKLHSTSCQSSCLLFSVGKVISGPHRRINSTFEMYVYSSMAVRVMHFQNVVFHPLLPL